MHLNEFNLKKYLHDVIFCLVTPKKGFEMDWPADKIERKKVSELIPYARNARTHSDEQVAQIAASINEWGWTTPVLIDEGGEIIAGHGRVLAARKLGIEEVPAMTAIGWSNAQKHAYVLADNQLPMNAEWNMDMLKLEIDDLKVEDFDLSLIGFHPSELIFEEIDYSILDEEDIDQKMESMLDASKRAIQIEFDLDNYAEAQELVSWWRSKKADIGEMVLIFLRSEKEKATET